MKIRAPHRGLADQPGAFAERFIMDRMIGFEKDMTICLTGVPSKDRKGVTHAYFPALASCPGTVEYMAGLYKGNIESVGWRDIRDWAARYLPQPDYEEDVIRVLVEAFRNSIAHRGIASGVWVDQKPNADGQRRRITWNVHADSRRPAVSFLPEAKVLRSDPPWECPYTHRAQIRLRSLFLDIRDGAVKFAEEVRQQEKLTKKFQACMKQLYPPA
jgi:hypothetical protein